jgi:hypothetical protein
MSFRCPRPSHKSHSPSPCRLSTLKTADTVVMMENGLVAEQGTYAELTAAGTRFNNLVASQMLMSAPTSSERIEGN